MRVAAYNVQECVRGVEWVAGVVRDLAADVVCLAEVRGKHLREIARIAGGRRIRGVRVRFGGAGIAMLTRDPARIETRRLLSKSPGLERRELLLARVGEVTVAAAHLGLTGEERLRHVSEILDALPPSGPIVLGADLNEPPDGPALALLLQRFTDTFATCGQGPGNTFPANAPKFRIDYVLTSGIRASSCSVPEVLAADHRPVVAEIA